jgi:hypothetical protein
LKKNPHLETRNFREDNQDAGRGARKRNGALR